MAVSTPSLPVTCLSRLNSRGEDCFLYTSGMNSSRKARNSDSSFQVTTNTAGQLWMNCSLLRIWRVDFCFQAILFSLRIIETAGVVNSKFCRVPLPLTVSGLSGGDQSDE